MLSNRILYIIEIVGTTAGVIESIIGVFSYLKKKDANVYEIADTNKNVSVNIASKYRSS